MSQTITSQVPHRSWLQELLTEWQCLIVAIMLLTRIPCPTFNQFDPTLLNPSSRYFSLVGILVGAIAAGIYLCAALFFTHEIAVILAMGSLVLITGAIHLDGVGDACDGLGGGDTRERIMAIMKDSRVGNYGVIGLWFVLTLTFLALKQIQPAWIPWVLIIGNSLSRGAMNIPIYQYSHSSFNEQTRPKLIVSEIRLKDVVVGLLIGLLPLMFFGISAIWILVPVCLMAWLLGLYFNWRMQGYTGDCLGTIQQACEITVYLCFCVGAWKFT